MEKQAIYRRCADSCLFTLQTFSFTELTPGNPMEIERKYLVPDLPAGWEHRPAAVIEQGYLALTVEGVEVRIRRKDAACFLTVKHGPGWSRIEVEVPLAPDQFDLLWPLTTGRRLRKTRHDLPGPGGLIFELDVYADALAGLQTVDVEFPDETAAHAFQPPAWFGREIGGEPAYRNEHLSRCGLPPAEDR